ncbi:MAG: TRAP transporter substrate-binding protein [Dethiobacteria bacterium]|jgi:TRAP-type C4-dicarboxylate transport system substrate-binding protein
MNMKKYCWLLVFVLMLTLLIGCSTGERPASPESESETGSESEAGVSQEKVTLRFANYFAGESGPGMIGQEFADDVKELTGGAVEIEYYPGGMLLAADKMYDGVMEGIADIGFSNLGYTFGRFPVTEVLDLPLGFPNAWVSNHVAAEFYKKFMPKEWEDTHVLTLHTSPANNILTVSKPVTKPEDMKGLILRGTGYIGKLVEALGGTPRPVAMPDAYDNLAKGVIDGLLIPYETTKTFRYGEVTNYVTEVWPLGQVYTFYIVMNKNTWNKLTPDTQDLITRYVEDEYLEKLAQMWNRIDIEGKEYAIESGYEILEIPPDELGRWQELASNVISDFTETLVAAGHSKEEVEGWLFFIEERIDYWSEKQKELGIKSSTGSEEVLYQFD